MREGARRGCGVVIIAVLYVLAGAPITAAFLGVGLVLGSSGTWLAKALIYLGIAAWPLLGVAVAYDTARRTGYGALAGAVIGAIAAGYSLWIGTSIETSLVFDSLYALAVLLSCVIGGLLGPRSSQRRDVRRE